MKKKYDSDVLKLIAMLSMLIDHTGAALIENTALYDVESFRMLLVTLRLVGRLAFPIFAFLLVEGFLHTSNVYRYFMRLWLCALISEIPFDLAIFGELTFRRQNVFFTLSLGLAMLLMIRESEKKNVAGLRHKIICIGSILVTCILAYKLSTDYSYMGILLIGILYLLRSDRQKQCVLGAFLFCTELTAMLAFPILLRYSGNKGNLNLPRWAFYLFYPLHLLLLWAIRILLIL